MSEQKNKDCEPYLDLRSKRRFFVVFEEAGTEEQEGEGLRTKHAKRNLWKGVKRISLHEWDIPVDIEKLYLRKIKVFEEQKRKHIPSLKTLLKEQTRVKRIVEAKINELKIRIQYTTRNIKQGRQDLKQVMTRLKKEFRKKRRATRKRKQTSDDTDADKTSSTTPSPSSGPEQPKKKKAKHSPKRNKTVERHVRSLYERDLKRAKQAFMNSNKGEIHAASKAVGVNRVTLDQHLTELTRLQTKLTKAQTNIRNIRNKIRDLNNDETMTRFLIDATPIVTEYTSIRTELGRETDPERMKVLKQDLLTLCARFCSSFCPDLYKEHFAKKVRHQRLVEEDTCIKCNGKMIKHSEGLSCASCGEGRTSLNLSLSYKQMQEMERRIKLTYRKINHFREFLRHLQGGNKSDVDEKTLEEIAAEMVVRRISPSELTPEIMSSILKWSGNSDEYEHCVQLVKLLNPEADVLKMYAHHEERLCLLFIKLEAPFKELQLKEFPERKNFLSYPYVAYQLMMHCGYYQYLPYIRLLKSRELLLDQERIYERICDKLGWNFIPVVGDVARTKIRHPVPNGSLTP